MIFRHSLSAVALAALLGLGAASPAAAHDSGQGQPYHYGWHQGWHMDPGMMGQGMMGPGMMGQGMMGPGMMGPGMMMQGCPMGGPGMMGPGMMGPGMMGPGMMGPGMMNQGMMGPGMMGPGMMDQNMTGPGMMGQGMMGQGMMNQGRPSMGGPRHMGPGYGADGDGAPMMAPEQGMRGMMMQPAVEPASVEDVTRMLQRRLDWQGNPHVKLGKVEEKDDDTILAEIVTQDGSLVERLEVDRRSGWMRMVP